MTWRRAVIGTAEEEEAVSDEGRRLLSESAVGAGGSVVRGGSTDGRDRVWNILSRSSNNSRGGGGERKGYY